MPRITHVARAQQRFATVPVLDDQGKPLMLATTKTTKTGRLITRARTRADYTQPLPNLVCDACREEIRPGSSYKHMSPRSGPFGGRQLSRHETCPDWKLWEYSNSLAARLARIAHDAQTAVDGVTSTDEVRVALEEAATAVREIADEKREAAQNIEEGFGHSTQQSEELADIAETLEAWADEIEAADIPDEPEPEEEECSACEGLGHTADTECKACSGSGQITPDEPTEEQWDAWASDVQDAIAIVEEVPV